MQTKRRIAGQTEGVNRLRLSHWMKKRRVSYWEREYNHFPYRIITHTHTQNIYISKENCVCLSESLFFNLAQQFLTDINSKGRGCIQRKWRSLCLLNDICQREKREIGEKQSDKVPLLQQNKKKTLLRIFESTRRHTHKKDSNSIAQLSKWSLRFLFFHIGTVTRPRELTSSFSYTVCAKGMPLSWYNNLFLKN